MIRQRGGWQPLHVKRLPRSGAPPIKYAAPKPDPVPKDTEAELDRLAEERAERSAALSDLLAFEDDP